MNTIQYTVKCHEHSTIIELYVDPQDPFKATAQLVHNVLAWLKSIRIDAELYGLDYQEQTLYCKAKDDREALVSYSCQ